MILLSLMLAATLLADPDPEPGSVEDCLAWSVADLDVAPAAERREWNGRVHQVSTLHFAFAMDRSMTAVDILKEQRELVRLGHSRKTLRSKDRDACLKSFPKPDPEDIPPLETKTPAG